MVLVRYILQAQTRLSPVFVNKVVVFLFKNKTKHSQPFHLHLVFGCFLPIMAEISCWEREGMACLKQLLSGPLPKDFANRWSGCSRFRRGVILVAGINYQRINGKNVPSQGSAGSGQTEKSEEGILGVGKSKGKDTEEQKSTLLFEEQKKDHVDRETVSFQSSWQEERSQRQEASQWNGRFPKPGRNQVCKR